MLVKRVPSPIRTGKSLVSMRIVPAGIGLIVAARTPATRPSFRPAATALARSTLTWTTGWLAARLVATSLLPGTPSMALTIASLAVWRSAVVAALRVMSTVDEVPKPPCWEPTVIFPASPSLESSLRTVSWSLPWLAFSSVTTVNVELDAPEESRAEKPVWALPVVAWTSLIPSMPRRVSSTRIAEALASSRLVPAGRACLTVMLFSPERPRRSVASSGDIATVPASTRAAATRVRTGCRCVPDRTGR
ncbi:hypothetical protein SRABI128_04446 [Microbacterium sp. Bi128]|nr:hypothetical protein SRABI128_04446 [Microbacterium sp. Bi128]